MNLEKEMNKTKIFYSSSACMYQSIIKLTLTTPIAVNNQHTQQTPIQNMDGRNSLVRDSTSHIIAITTFPVRVARYIISLDRGDLEWRKGESTELQSAARLLSFRSKVDLSRCGEMVYKLVPSCSLMNASKQLED